MFFRDTKGSSSKTAIKIIYLLYYRRMSYVYSIDLYKRIANSIFIRGVGVGVNYAYTLKLRFFVLSACSHSTRHFRIFRDVSRRLGELCFLTFSNRIPNEKFPGVVVLLSNAKDINAR